MTEFSGGHQTGYAALNNGGPATLFSSDDQQTVDTHFLWMRQNGCDTGALQRFDPNGSEGPTRDAMATKVRSAAESYDRTFSIMYDVTGWTNMQTEIEADWTAKMSALTASSAYAVQNGRPVVGIWGFGFNDANHPWSAADCLDVVTWFQSHRRLRRGVPAVQRPRPGRLQRQRDRLPALRAARRRLRPVQLRPAGAGRGRHRLLLGLLPAAHPPTAAGCSRGSWR